MSSDQRKRRVDLVRFRILASELFHAAHEREPALVAEPDIDHANALARAVEPVVEEIMSVCAKVSNDRPVSQPPEGSTEPQPVVVVRMKCKKAHPVELKQTAYRCRRTDSVDAVICSSSS